GVGRRDGGPGDRRRPRPPAEAGVAAVIVDKPWGRVSTYSLNQPSSVRVIMVEPGHETSEHYHRLRDELWIVLDEGLQIQIGNKVVDARPGDEFVVGSEEPHRITNTGSKRGRVLE